MGHRHRSRRRAGFCFGFPSFSARCAVRSARARSDRVLAPADHRPRHADKARRGHRPHAGRPATAGRRRHRQRPDPGLGRAEADHHRGRPVGPAAARHRDGGRRAGHTRSEWKRENSGAMSACCASSCYERANAVSRRGSTAIMIASSARTVVARAGSAATAGACRHAGGIVRPLLMAAVLCGAYLPNVTRAEELSKPAAPMEARVKALIPDLEAYIERAMKAYDLPGLAIGIVTGDRLVHAKGFGVRSKAGGAPIDTRTAFQIGSLTKGFLATTTAIMVDRGKVHWDDRVVDLHPAFQLQDAWVTREFRIFDLMAQRSGLRPLVNDAVGLLGYTEPAAIRSLRYVEPVSSFRTTFAYTNVTHLLTGRIVASPAGAPDWNAVAQRELLDPLGMAETTFTAEAMQAAANRAQGYRWTPDGTIEVPFEPLFPYGFGAAGNINSTLEDMARWLRLQLANGSFEGRRIVSPDSLAYTRLPKVAIENDVSYA